MQILRQPPHDLDLLLGRQARDGRLNDAAHARLIDGDETLIIHEGEKAHDELAIHAVRDAAVAGDGLAEVFDFEGPFQTRGEEAAEGRDQGREGCEDEDVELHGRDVQGEEVGGERQPGGQVVGVWEEDGVRGAFEAGEDVGAEVLLVVVSVRFFWGWSDKGEPSGSGLGQGRSVGVCAYVDGTDKVLVSHEDVGHGEAEDDG